MQSFQGNLTRFKERIAGDPAVAFLDGLTRELPDGEVYFVGGMVRDAALGENVQQDYDLVVRGVPAARLQSFLASAGKVSLVGKRFGVFKFTPRSVHQALQMDIALPRTEHSLGPGSYRGFDIQSDSDLAVSEDLSRRDFTINAMAWDWKQSRLIDPFHGLEDLQAKTVRAVGDPQARFQEDYSRILRALRFSSQLGFSLESETRGAAIDLIGRINDTMPEESRERIVPFEVIAKEMLKAFVADPVRAFDLYDEIGAFKHLIPELLDMKGCPQPEMYHSEGDVWTHTRLAMKNLTSDLFREQTGSGPLDGELVMSVLLHDIGKPSTMRTPEEHGVDRIRFDQHDIYGAGLAKKICLRLKLSSPPADDRLHVNADNVWWLIKNHLIGIRSDIEQMRNRTVEKYFLLDEKLGGRLMKLMLADGLATISPDGQPPASNYFLISERVEALKAIRSQETFVQSLLTGHEIMQRFGLKEGPLIGRLLGLLREEQLAGRVKSKAEAEAFLREQDQYTL